MAQRIKNVKVGDKFIVNVEITGFEKGVIVESISEEKNIHNKEERSIRCKYVSGKSQWKHLELWHKTIDLKRYRGNNMSQKIVNIKAGQKFITINNIVGGFHIGTIVEAQETRMNCEESAGVFKLIGRVDEKYSHRNKNFIQWVCELKRYKGKIK